MLRNDGRSEERKGGEEGMIEKGMSTTYLGGWLC